MFNDITYVKGVGEKKAKDLAKLGIKTTKMQYYIFQEIMRIEVRLQIQKILCQMKMYKLLVHR